MIFQKLGFFGRVQREGDQFLRIFRATRGVANPQALASAGSPFATVYASGYRELQNQVGASYRLSQSRRQTEKPPGRHSKYATRRRRRSSPR